MGGGLPPPIVFQRRLLTAWDSQVFFLNTIYCELPLPGRLTDAFVPLWGMDNLQVKERYPTNETVHSPMQQPEAVRGGKNLLEQITAYVQENLAQKLTLRLVADQFRVSVSTVTQLFQKKTHSTFHHFVTNCRMEKARALILQGMPLESVGREIGYQDHSTFYRAFHQTFGISPREFRKSMIPDTTK